MPAIPTTRFARPLVQSSGLNRACSLLRIGGTGIDAVSVSSRSTYFCSQVSSAVDAARTLSPVGWMLSGRMRSSFSGTASWTAAVSSDRRLRDATHASSAPCWLRDRWRASVPCRPARRCHARCSGAIARGGRRCQRGDRSNRATHPIGAFCWTPEGTLLSPTACERSWPADMM